MLVQTIKQEKYLRLIRPYKTIGTSTINKLWRAQGNIHNMHIEVIGLFIALGHKIECWDHWLDKHFRCNPYAREGLEFEGKPDNDFRATIFTFRVTAEFAKHIAMVDNTHRSVKVIRYLNICLCHWQITLKLFADRHFQNLERLGKGGLHNIFKFWEGTPWEFIEKLQEGCLEAVDDYDNERVKTYNIVIG